MTRRMRPAPTGVIAVKTTRGSWIALEEVWDSANGDRLIELRPLRLEGDPEAIAQANERREIVAAVENAILRARLHEAETRLRELRGRSDSRSEGRYGVAS